MKGQNIRLLKIIIFNGHINITLSNSYRSKNSPPSSAFIATWTGSGPQAILLVCGPHWGYPCLDLF